MENIDGSAGLKFQLHTHLLLPCRHLMLTQHFLSIPVTRHKKITENRTIWHLLNTPTCKLILIMTCRNSRLYSYTETQKNVTDSKHPLPLQTQRKRVWWCLHTYADAALHCCPSDAIATSMATFHHWWIPSKAMLSAATCHIVTMRASVPLSSWPTAQKQGISGSGRVDISSWPALASIQYKKYLHLINAQGNPSLGAIKMQSLLILCRCQCLAS